MRSSHLPKIAIAGSVNSSLRTLEKLIEHKCNVQAVLCVDPEYSRNISGYQNLKPVAEENELDFMYFKNINDQKVYEFLDFKKIDYFFIVGLSQLVKKPLLNLPSQGCIGFHPTKLPEGRGRGAVAWLILGKASGAATFFIMDEGMDSGPIVIQQDFEIGDHDYAADVIEKIKETINKALDDLLPILNEGRLKPERQQGEITFLGRRKPKDGLINWNQSSESVYKLIRASSPPLPGAFTFYNGEKIIILKAAVESRFSYIGVPGRILRIQGEKLLVATLDGAIWIEKYFGNKNIEFKVEQDFIDIKK